MEYQKFMPEGWLKDEEKFNLSDLQNAMQTGKTLQGKVFKCDDDFNLHIKLGNNINGIIPKNEVDVLPIKDSIYKNKENTMVQFKVKSIDEGSDVVLSRKEVKQDTMNWIKQDVKEGDVVCGIVKNIRPYGAFVEIGGGVVGLLHVEDISVSRIKGPEERFEIGQRINVVVKSIDKENDRIVLSYKELLGDWDENVEGLEEKMVVDGIIKEADKYKNGIFIELKPNLVGMAEYKEGLEYGQKVKVLIKKIIKSKKKIKVVIV